MLLGFIQFVLTTDRCETVGHKRPGALRRPLQGESAASQPGSCADVLFHEIAVSWIKTKLVKTTPTNPCAETPEAFGQRLQKVVEEINGKHDVDGLCRGWPKRLATVVEKEGDQIGH